MSSDYHERTRLFSAKSFLGNLFAMGTPWLIFLAGLEFFRGNGDLTDGMRYVSMFIAAILIPLAYWWFLVLREPGFVVAKAQAKEDCLLARHAQRSQQQDVSQSCADYFHARDGLQFRFTL